MIKNKLYNNFKSVELAQELQELVSRLVCEKSAWVDIITSQGES